MAIITNLGFFHGHKQTWGQFHLHSIPNEMYQFQFFKFQFRFLLILFTMSRYSEYLLRVVYIPSRIVMEEIFLNQKIK